MTAGLSISSRLCSRQRTHYRRPEWKERLAALNAGISQEDGAKVAKEYCREIATIIVTQGSDYVPDGTIEGEVDYT